jgi:hypothetical protein
MHSARFGVNFHQGIPAGGMTAYGHGQFGSPQASETGDGRLEILAPPTTVVHPTQGRIDQAVQCHIPPDHGEVTLLNDFTGKALRNLMGGSGAQPEDDNARCRAVQTMNRIEPPADLISKTLKQVAPFSTVGPTPVHFYARRLVDGNDIVVHKQDVQQGLWHLAVGSFSGCVSWGLRVFQFQSEHTTINGSS